MKPNKHYHLIGIGGIAMSQLGFLLKNQGNHVTGSDSVIYPPVSDILKKWKLPVTQTPQLKNIDSANVIIVGNAISRGNLELEYALSKNKTIYSMPQILHSVFLQNKTTIVVAGTHGKTTTALLIDHLLIKLGKQPGIFAGGYFKNGNPAARQGTDSIFVIEGDEYDSCFFDKGAKFFHYFPTVLILTSLEYDHIDIYPSFTDYINAFRLLIRLVPSNGLIIANGAYNYRELSKLVIDESFAPVFFYCKKQYQIRLQKKISKSKRSKDCSLNVFPYDAQGFAYLQNHKFEKINLPETLSGEMNKENFFAALLALKYFFTKKTLSPTHLQRAVSDFIGAKRRQELLYECHFGLHNLSIIEDFAHHPTAVTAVIQSFRKSTQQRIFIHVFFEPRSNSAQHRMFSEQYTHSLEHADFIYLCEVANKKKYSKHDALDSKKIVSTINAKHNQIRAYYGKSPQHLLEIFIKNFFTEKSHTLLKSKNYNPKNQTIQHKILFLSNGSFGGIAHNLVQQLKVNKQVEKLSV